MPSEENKKNILDLLKNATEKPGKVQGTPEERTKETAGRRTVLLPEDEFDINLLISSGEVKKVIKDGNISACFKTVPAGIIFEIDTKTDAITSSVLSGNSRRGFRYACAALLGYGIKDKYIDFKNKTWEEKEEIFLKMPNVLVNKILQLHSRFERDAALLFTPETVKNS